MKEFFEIPKRVMSCRNLHLGGNNLSLYDTPGELLKVMIGKIKFASKIPTTKKDFSQQTENCRLDSVEKD